MEVTAYPAAVLPWHQPAWHQLVSQARHARLPQALLLQGAQGSGRHQLANVIANWVVCDAFLRADAAGPACGHCKQCQLIQAGAHPDVRLYQPEDAKVIKVDQMRALTDFLMQSPQVARIKVAIIAPSDRLNINAANALLKTLEEPPEDVLILLLHTAGEPLLPTIRSRCQAMLLPAASPDQSLNWLLAAVAEGKKADATAFSEADCQQALQWSSGSPLRAKSMLLEGYAEARAKALEALRLLLKGQLGLSDAVRAFKQLTLDGSLHLMLAWCLDLLRLQQGLAAADTLAQEMLRFLAQKNPPDAIQALHDALLESRRGQVHNLSPEHELERLLLQWLALMPQRQRA